VRVSDALIPTFRLAVLGVLVSASLASAQTAAPITRLVSLGDGPTNITAVDTTGAAIAAGGLATVGVQVSGTFSGTLAVQCSIDGTNYQALNITEIDSTTPATSLTTEGIWTANIAGCRYVRVRSTAWTSGTAVTSLVAVSSGGGTGASSVAVQDVNVSSVDGSDPPGPARCLDDSLVQSVPISTATANDNALVAVSGTTKVYVCGYSFVTGGTVNVKLRRGAGSACATSASDMTGAMEFVVNGGISVPNAGAVQLVTAAGEGVCVHLSGAVNVRGSLTYVQQ
jgi:hypothetical protein